MVSFTSGTLLKISLAVVATGASIATPLLLNKKIGALSTSANDSFVGDSHISGSENYTEPSSALESLQATRENSGPSSITNLISPQANERFEKMCFEIPANYESDEEGIKLLTCFDSNSSENENSETEPEYESQFHLYDRSQNKIPLKIKGNLYWERESNRITAKMKKEEISTGKEYIFSASGDGWNGISSSSKIDLLEQCAIYKVTSKDSINFGKFWLSCGDDTGKDFNTEAPTSISLTSWINGELIQ